MSTVTRAMKIEAAIATSIAEDRTVTVRVRVDATGNLDWMEDALTGVDDIDDAANASVEDADGECTYDVWGTTDSGESFRLSVVEYGGC